MSLGHHWQVIRAAIRADKERAKTRATSLAPEFLPAALEVVERPVSPTARVTAWAAMIFVVIAGLWVTFGQVDVVASAPGKILPSGSSKLVQSANYGTVAAIHVRDGDVVHAGQVLIDLDTTLSGADLEQAQKALLADELDIAGKRALVDAIDGKGLHFVAPAGTPPDVAATRASLVAAEYAELTSTVAGYAAARTSSEAEAHAAAATRAKVDETLPILDREVAAMRSLDTAGYAPGMRLLELQRQRRAEAGDRDVAIAQEARGLSEAHKFADAMVQVRDTTRRQALADLAKAEADAILKREDVTKAARKAGLQHLVAPADGTVQQLQVHTIGGVVEPAKAVMVIVPEHNQIEVEAHVLNRDAGFVHSGQSAAVKIEAFPFTRYGTVRGTVEAISRDAVPDPKLGATYVVRIRLEHDTIRVDGRDELLTAGLGITADIRTGSRPILSWLLSPILTTVDQAGRER